MQHQLSRNSENGYTMYLVYAEFSIFIGPFVLWKHPDSDPPKVLGLIIFWIITSHAFFDFFHIFFWGSCYYLFLIINLFLIS